MSDVSILYRNSEITSLSNTGIKTLETGGKYCDSDIEIQYTKPAAPTPSLQAKTNIAPATTSQTITADSGYDGLSSVQINAMPAGSATTPATTITANPSISVNLFGEITASVSKSQKVTPTVSAGYVSSGTYGTVTVSGSSTEQLTTKAAQTFTPTTTNHIISAGQYLTGTQTILGDANLLAENIKKDVSIFNVTGTYEGSGGGGQTNLIYGAIRPDAELWKSITYDKHIVADEEATLPAYSTATTTLKASESSDYIIDLTTYDYAVVVRFICIPEYSVTTTGKGRFEYNVGGQIYELVHYPSRTFYTLVNSQKAVTSTVSKVLAYGINTYSCYWTSATGVGALNGNSYGATIQPQAPSISGSTFTVKTPIIRITGSTTYLSQTYWDAITDIRYQYRVDVYRVPKDSLNVRAYAINSLSWHALDCVMSDDHTLT